MNPVQILIILRERYKVGVLVLVATMATVMTVSMQLPTRYTATASVLVDVRSPDPIAALFVPSSLATQVDIINSERVSRKVVKLLKLDESPGAKEQWMDAGEGKGTLDRWLGPVLQKGLSVSPSRDSNIINISYSAVDSGFATIVANAFAQAYIDTIVEIKVEPARQYALWFEGQGQKLRENVEQAQTRLSKYQQEKGIVASDERLDTETAKLNELSSQLTMVQAQTSDARSKQKSGSDADRLPEVMQNPLISGLKSDILRQEAKLQETAVNLGRNHPQYQRMESEVAALKQKLEAETRLVTSGFSASRTVGQDKESDLRALIAAQKKKLLELKSARDELAVLQRDVDAAKNAYDSVTARYNQTSLAAQATQTNVSVLSPAVEPVEPSSPKPLHKMLLLSIFLGIALGVGAAYGLEMLDRRIRSADDLAEMLHVPVLGVIERARTRGRLPFSGAARLRLR